MLDHERTLATWAPEQRTVRRSQCYETIGHLIVAYAYSRDVWFEVLHWAGWQQVTPTEDDHFKNWWLASMKIVPKTLHKAFDSLTLLLAWSLWLQRNDRVFNSRSVSPPRLV
jgi:hypothetical protein